MKEDDDGPKTMTRRAFLRLSTREQEASEEDDRPRPVPSEAGRTEGSAYEWLTNTLRTWGRTTLFAVVVVIALTGGLLSSAAVAESPSAAPQKVSPEAAIDAQERALALRAELVRIDAKAGVDMSKTVFGAIDDDLAQGNASYREGNFAEAEAQFQDAARKARGELTRAYTTRAELLINASAAHLGRLQEKDYRTTEMAVLSDRVEQLRQRSTAVDSLTDARDLHEDAVSLRSDVDSKTPHTMVVTGVRALLDGWGLIPLGLVTAVVFLVGRTIGVRRERERQAEQESRGRSRNVVSDSSSSIVRSDDD